MDKDVSTEQPQGQGESNREERARRRQSLLNRMMGARGKRVRPADVAQSTSNEADGSAPEPQSKSATPETLNPGISVPGIAPNTLPATVVREDAPDKRPEDGASHSPLHATPLASMNEAQVKAGYGADDQTSDINTLVQRRAVPVPDAPLANEIKSAASQAVRESDLPVVTQSVKAQASQAVQLRKQQQTGTQDSGDRVSDDQSAAAGTLAIEALQNQIYRLKATIATVEKRFLNSKKVHKDQYDQVQKQLDTLVEQVSAAEQAGDRAREAAQSAAAHSLEVDIAKQEKFEVLKKGQLVALRKIQAQVTSWSADIEGGLAALKAAEQHSVDQQQAMLETGIASTQQQVAMDELAEQMRGLKAELAQAVSDACDARSAIEKAQAHWQEQWQEEVGAQQKHYSEMCEKLRVDLESGETLKQQLLETLQQARTQKEALASDFDTIKSGVLDQQTALEKEQQGLSELREETHKMITVANAARKVAVKYNNNTAARLEEITKLADDIDQIHQDAAAQEAALAAHREFVSTQTESQKALAKTLVSETTELTRLSEDIYATEKEIQQLKSDVHTGVDQVEAVSHQVVQQAEAVEQHLSRIYEAVDHYTALEKSVKDALTAIDSALSEQQKGLNKVSELEQQFDVAVETVAYLQNQWETRDQDWAVRSSANDENYRNLVALLERSRQNEATLEGLLESVKALEQRSEDLLNTAQTQCTQQAQMQTDLSDEQTRWDDLIAGATRSAESAQNAAETVEKALADVKQSATEVQTNVATVAEVNDAVAAQVDAAKQWMNQALVKTDDWQKNADAIVARQADLAEHCEKLVERSLLQGADINEVRTQAQALAGAAQERLTQTEALAQRVAHAVSRLDKKVGEADANQADLITLAAQTKKQLSKMIAENRALANQSRNLQHRVSDQADGVAEAQTELGSALNTLNVQQQRSDDALAKIESFCAQWAAHQQEMNRIESQSADALQGTQQLQASAHQIMDNASAEQARIQTALNTVDHLSDQVGQVIAAEQNIRTEAQALCEQVQQQAITQEQVTRDQAEATLRTEVMHDQITALDQSAQVRLGQLEDLHQQVAGLLTENMTLQSDLKQARQHVGDLADRAEQQMDGAAQLNQQTETHLAGATERLVQIDNLVPKLTEDMNRFAGLGADYEQWESRLKSQSMTLKESEQKLKDLTKKLEQGLSEAAKVREEMTQFQTEFGGLKKVLAQVLQKFKGLEQSTSFLESQEANRAETQAKDQTRLQALEAQGAQLLQQLGEQEAYQQQQAQLQAQLQAELQAQLQEQQAAQTNATDPAVMEDAVKKIELQALFNDKVLGQFEHFSQGYAHLKKQLQSLPELISQTVAQSMTPMQTSLDEVAQRVAALEGRLGHMESEGSFGQGDDALLEKVQAGASVHQQQINQLTDAVSAIQAQLNGFSDFAQSSKTALTRGLHAAHPPQGAANAISAELTQASAVTSQTSPHDVQQEDIDDDEMDSGALQSPAHIKVRTPAESRLDKLSKAFAGISHEADSANASEGQTHEQGVFQNQEAKIVSQGPDSELDIISQQLEKLSQESQTWDDQFHETAISKKKSKNFLFSLLGIMVIVGGGFWMQQSGLSTSAPYYAQTQIDVSLKHPAQDRMGPHLALASENPVIQNQVKYAYHYNDETVVLQWPLPDQLAGEHIHYGMANSALFIKGALHTPVVAIASGEVVFSGVNEGQFGQMVIVQHQDALMSVYGHLDETFVDDGERVSRGQVIARLGKSQWLEPRLYFEIRYEGQSEDPYLYFAS